MSIKLILLLKYRAKPTKIHSTFPCCYVALSCLQCGHPVYPSTLPRPLVFSLFPSSHWSSLLLWCHPYRYDTMCLSHVIYTNERNMDQLSSWGWLHSFTMVLYTCLNLPARASFFMTEKNVCGTVNPCSLYSFFCLRAPKLVPNGAVVSSVAISRNVKVCCRHCRVYESLIDSKEMNTQRSGFTQTHVFPFNERL